MTPKTAVTTLTQGEKIKSGIIWANEVAGTLPGLGPGEKAGAEKTLVALIRMIGFEAVLTRRNTGNDAWMDVEKDLDMALVMIHSGVSHEATFHLNKALHKTTSLTQKSMAYLIDKGIL